jgi:histidinol-phosphate aminotransferase
MTSPSAIDAASPLPAPHAVVALLPVYSQAPRSDVPLRFRASSNESAFPPPPSVIAAAQFAIARANRYPAINGTELIENLSLETGLAPSALAVADGALSLLQHVLTAFVTDGQSVVFPWRSYEAYPICVQLAGALARPIPLTPSHEHDLPAMSAAVDSATAAIILCNPNNPTGTAFGRTELVEFLEGVPGNVLVVYDEAYRDFVDQIEIPTFSATDLVAEYPNLVVLRTFSKVYSLAGLRVGYLVGSETVTSAVRRVIPPFPLTGAAIAAATAALADHGFRERMVAVVQSERARVAGALTDLGIEFVPSQGNFLWLPLGEASEALGQRLRAHGIAVRVFPGEGVRITVGEAGLAEALVGALAEG